MLQLPRLRFGLAFRDEANFRGDRAVAWCNRSPRGARSAADEDLSLHEQEAFKAAVDRVAPSVVKIETIGGMERVGNC